VRLEALGQPINAKAFRPYAVIAGRNERKETSSGVIERKY
jgi:hypothetical protein